MELHFVHFKASYGTFDNALTKSDGLAVLGVLFELSSKDNPDLEPLIAALPEIVTAGEHNRPGV